MLLDLLSLVNGASLNQRAVGSTFLEIFDSESLSRQGSYVNLEGKDVASPNRKSRWGHQHLRAPRKVL